MNMLTLTAEYILKIPRDKPEKIFSYDEYLKESKLLLKKWHPDTCTHVDAGKVTAHINVLLQTAKIKIANNTWSNNAIFGFESKGTTYQMKYKKHHKFELGDMYIGDKIIIYVIKPEYEKLAKNTTVVIKSFKYASDRMKSEFQRFLPYDVLTYSADCGSVFVMNKTKDQLLLQDVIDYYDNHTMPLKQVMWVISSLYNISCFLEYNKIVHNAISPMNIFISPEYHSVALLGGWWYARSTGDKLLGIPGNLMKIFPRDVISNKRAITKCDRLLIKATGMMCLGDDTMSGSKLSALKEIPSGLVHWLRQPSNDTAAHEYKEWMQVLIEQLGPRKFTPYDITVNDIY